MKKATTKILLAALSLVMALGIATGSTFAWFTANRTVQIGAINATVTSGTQGLYVAIWDQSASSGEGAYTAFEAGWDANAITAAVFGSTQNPSGTVLLDALTSANNGETLTRENSQTAVTFSATAQNNAFLEIKLKFRTTTAQDIYLGYDGSNFNSTISPVGNYNSTPVLAWTTIAADTYGTHSQIAASAALETRAAYAARVAFLTTANSETTGVVWAPYDYTTDNSDGYNTQAGFYKGNLARDYRNNLLDMNSTYTVANTNAVKLELDSNAESNTITTGATKIVSTTDNGHGQFDAEVTVRIWIEGTDGDCLNSIFSDILAVNLVFNCIDTPQQQGNG